MERKTYIQNHDDKEALASYLAALGSLLTEEEQIAPADAFGRVTAKAVYAKKCDPMYNAAAMDGIAVLAEKTAAAKEDAPLRLVLDKDFCYINTGGALTGRYNAVIMIEDVIIIEDGEVEILAPAYPWQHVRVIGESIVAGEMVVPSRHKVSAADIGAMIAAGQTEIAVYKQARVGIIPTGAEMIDDPAALTAGKLMESNSKVFAALVTQYGGIPKRYPVVHDDAVALKSAVVTALSETDFVIVNAGSSAGTKDYTAKVIASLGEIVVHGIAIKPGKPTILGVANGKPIIGIPGYPVSAYLVFEMFARPVLEHMRGANPEAGIFTKATLTKRITSTFKNAELIRMALGKVEGKLVAAPLERGAAAIMSLVKADGLLKIERLTEGMEAGTEADIRLLKPLVEIEKALVIVGSHDMIIDVVSDKMAVSSAHVGSLSGIFALREKACHIAPIHLLDEETGAYNISYVKKYFPSQKMALIKGVGRVQGFLTPAGNPRGVASVRDLKDKNLSFANRQRGAGTRVLFDYSLKKEGIAPSAVLGYEKEFGTHLAVAVAVKNGVADTGLAVFSAAKALELGFVPLGKEEYDFLLPYAYLDDPRVQTFIETIRSAEFKKKLDELGGYTYDAIGEIRIIE